ncbi:T9SS type A sorting domain-containing protein [Chryseobacterium camelliae]|uniref:T9SS type A sorting domain-containing protein n=1 Tax=Chryseobacterium camelliae TaxID=1265445 RepID=A0ABY7QM30_9FLAO|nr:T9SS type A sorting domain-containing protein [Chryseobacterium camelliae]WBV60738.1 T9SS type A sorting domain-containing protein [Chryseobacterium camelliae]
MKTKFYFSFFLLLFSFVSFAQMSVNASGGGVANVNNTISYSIGQPFYHQVNGGGFILIEGVQQPYEIITMGTSDYSGIELGMKVYPNPTSSLLFLKIDGMALKDLSYQLFDSSGRNIFHEKIRQVETSIDLGSKPSGVYILSVFNTEKNIKTFKIIKN